MSDVAATGIERLYFCSINVKTQNRYFRNLRQLVWQALLTSCQKPSRKISDCASPTLNCSFLSLDKLIQHDSARDAFIPV